MAETFKDGISFEKHLKSGLDEDFSSLNLSDISPEKSPAKQPKRILHFSDGTLEEYSSDEEEKETVPDALSLVDPKSLPWGQWVNHVATQTGKSVLATCDYVGESIANFLGITSQRYFYEIEEYKRAMKQEEEEKKEIAAEMAGWSTELTNLECRPDVEEPLVQSHIQKQFKKKDSPAQKDSEESGKY